MADPCPSETQFFLKYIFRFVRQFCPPYLWYYVTAVVCVFITNFLVTSIPKYLGHIIDETQEMYLQHDFDMMTVLHEQLAVVIFFAVLHFLFRSFSRVCVFVPSRKIEERTKNELQRRALLGSKAFFKQFSRGDLTSRIMNDVNSVRLIFAVAFLQSVNTVSVYCIVIHRLLNIHSYGILCIFIPLPIALLGVRLLVKRYSFYVKKKTLFLSRMVHFLFESFASISLIKGWMAEYSFEDRYHQINQETLDNNQRLALTRAIMFPLMSMISFVATFFLLWFGSQAIHRGEMTIGQFFEILSYIMIISWPTAALAWVWGILKQGGYAIERFYEVYDYKDPIQLYFSGSLSLSKGIPDIELRNISLSYNQHVVLDDLSLYIEPGERVGIFGLTGVGKSSLLSILALRRVPDQGAIFLNGKDIREYSYKDVLLHWAMVEQTPYFFSQTIAETVSSEVGYFWVDYSSVEKILDKACFLQEALNFPDGLDTVIGRRGVVLSGGQKKRLALARAYFKSPEILLLDDIFTAVDLKTEYQMMTQLLTQDRIQSIILVSQNTRVLKNFDRILILEHGRISASGSHQELLKKSQIYAELWKYQNEE